MPSLVPNITSKQAFALAQKNVISKELLQWPRKSTTEVDANFSKNILWPLIPFLFSGIKKKTERLAGDFIMDLENAIIRGGVQHTEAGFQLPTDFVEITEGGKSLAQTSAYPINFFTEEFTKVERWLTKVGKTEGQHASAQIDFSFYESLINQIYSQLEKANSIGLELITEATVLGATPKAFIGKGYLRYLFDASVKPDKADTPAKMWADLWEPKLKYYFGLCDAQFKNCKPYHPYLSQDSDTDWKVKVDFGTPLADVTDANAVKTTLRKIYHVGTAPNKNNPPKGITRTTSLIGMAVAIFLDLQDLSLIDDVSNWMNFDPNKTTQATEEQFMCSAPSEQFDIFLNADDAAELELGVSYTGPSGNRKTTSLEFIRNKVRRVYPLANMLPGFYQIRHHESFKIIPIFRSSEHHRANQFAYDLYVSHFWFRVVFFQYAPGIRRYPVSFVASQKFYSTYWDELKEA